MSCARYNGGGDISLTPNPELKVETPEYASLRVPGPRPFSGSNPDSLIAARISSGVTGFGPD
jgi:hypothetical protein